MKNKIKKVNDGNEVYIQCYQFDCEYTPSDIYQ